MLSSQPREGTLPHSNADNLPFDSTTTIYGIYDFMGIYGYVWVCMAIYGIWNTTEYGIFGYMGMYGCIWYIKYNYIWYIWLYG